MIDHSTQTERDNRASLEKTGAGESKADLAPAAASRRVFLGAVTAGVMALPPLLNSQIAVAAQIETQAEVGPVSGRKRAKQALKNRVEAAENEKSLPVAAHPTNGDEELYANKIASYSKGLPHNHLGEVDLNAYDSFIRALTSGNPGDFENIVMGLGRKFVNPQAGLAFEMEGPDSHSLMVRPAPAFSSAEEAGEIAELYWQALTRDVAFSDYDSDPLINRAAIDLSRLSDFRGPKINGAVTAGALFRGNAPGCLNGPHISQFLWKEAPFGAERIERRMRTTIAGLDYMTGYDEWLAVQNGFVPGENEFDPTPRYIRNNRDLSQWVHVDVLFQAYFNALLILFGINAPVDASNPYRTSKTQIGFGTLGSPYIASIVCAVARPALKAVWYQKWFVHRRLRPEVFAGRIHNHLTGAARYPIHQDILTSEVVNEVFKNNGTYLLPMAYPEGSPTHPAYGAGHATVAGACVTVLKAFFDESFIIPDPVEANADGTALMPYVGPPLTVGGELNKLAANIAIGRNAAGVHWRSDATDSLKLGEEVAIKFLREERSCFNEQFNGFSLTKFDGTTITI